MTRSSTHIRRIVHVAIAAAAALATVASVAAAKPRLYTVTFTGHGSDSYSKKTVSNVAGCDVTVTQSGNGQFQFTAVWKHVDLLGTQVKYKLDPAASEWKGTYYASMKTAADGCLATSSNQCSAHPKLSNHDISEFNKEGSDDLHVMAESRKRNSLSSLLAPVPEMKLVPDKSCSVADKLNVSFPVSVIADLFPAELASHKEVDSGKNFDWNEDTSGDGALPNEQWTFNGKLSAVLEEGKTHKR